MTGGCECSKVGAVPIEEGMTQKTARKKHFMIPAGTPPEVGPPPGRGAYGVRSSRPHNGRLLPPRVDRLTQLSGTERQGCSWGACRESDGRAAAQPPCACTRTQKVAWRRCCRVQLAAPRSHWRSQARPGHRSRRPNKQQRKIDSYTAVPVASIWPPSRHRHLWSHLSRHRARPFCRHITSNMILSHPGAWSAEPSGQLAGPCSHRTGRCRFMLLAQRMAMGSARRATGDANHIRSSRSMVQMDAAPVSTAAVASSRPLDDPG